VREILEIAGIFSSVCSFESMCGILSFSVASVFLLESRVQEASTSLGDREASTSGVSILI
jgi:hypothetical protein